MQVPIRDIRVNRRIRRELGDVGALAESLKRHGQISPILITKKNVLIAGRRRLEAARLLGWRNINAVISDSASALAHLELELEENVQRRDFTPEEVAEATRRIHRLRNPGFLRRLFSAIIRFFKRLFGISED